MLLPQPKHMPDAFQKLLNFWSDQGLVPQKNGDGDKDKVFLKWQVRNQNGEFWGGFAILLTPKSPAISKVRAVLLEIFGEVYWDSSSNLVIVPFVHASEYRPKIQKLLVEILADFGAIATLYDKIETPTILDSSAVWLGKPIPLEKKNIILTFAFEKSVWPLTAKKVSEASKIFDLLGIKSKYQIKTFHDFLSLCQELPQAKIEHLSKIIPDISLLSDPTVSSLQWQALEAPLKKFLKSHFPWGDFDDISPPIPLKIPTLVAIDAENLLLLYLVREPATQLKTVTVTEFFKKHGVLLTTDQVTTCLKNFVFTEATGAKIRLEYKIRGKTRVWVIVRQGADGSLNELSINPFYL
jgi:hypothetical protein